MDFLHTLFYTFIIKRPYVLIFLITFLFLGFKTKGPLWTFVFLGIGYLIAWTSEFLSIHYGFPYGLYFYIYWNLQGEWLNHGVPVWDSLSYTFMNFAGLGLAEFVFRKINTSPYLLLKKAFLAALFVTLLDVVVDPLAHRGDQWFLGKIYYYAYPGLYFDVPLSNYIGWYLVAFSICLAGLVFAKYSQSSSPAPETVLNKYGVLGLYFGIFLFNWIITLVIGQYTLALFDLLWISIPLLLIYRSKNA